MSSSLLDLPPEIIDKILTFVSPADLLLRCSVANRFLRDAIAQSSRHQHAISLYLSGVEDTPAPNLSCQQRLQKLQEREEAIMSLTPSFVRTVPCPADGGHLYDLSRGVLFLGGRQRLYFLRLPTSPTEAVNWANFSAPDGHFILDFGLSMDDDLIALVSLTPQSDPADRSRAVQLSLRQISTSSVHPSSRDPIITLYKLKQAARPLLSLEIMGDILVLVLEHQAGTQDRLYVFNWKTGERKLAVAVEGNTWSGLILLTHEYFLLPNLRTGTLDIWKIPGVSHGPTSASPKPFLSLGLPELEDGWTYQHVACRCEPNPEPPGQSSTLQGGNTHAPFRVPSSSAMIIAHVRVDLAPALRALRLHLGIGPEAGRFTLFVKRQSILDLLESELKGDVQYNRHLPVEADQDRDSRVADGLYDSDLGRMNDLLSETILLMDDEIDQAPPDPTPSQDAPSDLPIMWESWGAPVSFVTCLDLLNYNSHWITSMFGTRFVAIRSPAEDENEFSSSDDEDYVAVRKTKRSLVLLDFNQRIVKMLQSPMKGSSRSTKKRPASPFPHYLAAKNLIKLAQGDALSAFIRTTPSEIMAPYFKNDAGGRRSGKLKTFLSFATFERTLSDDEAGGGLRIVSDEVMIDGDWIVAVKPSSQIAGEADIEILYFGASSE